MMTMEAVHPPISLSVNGRDYLWPVRPTVVICFDGCDPAYLEAARQSNAIPAIDRMAREGFASVALAAMPTFTSLPGVALALLRHQACERFDLPEDREGDLAIVADRGTAIGARAEDHDLSQLAGERLRSHGGLSEQEVPFLLSHPINPRDRAELAAAPLRNFDIFSIALNRVRA
jgi:phosphonoacetate hydrolase